MSKYPIATIEMENGKKMSFELYIDKAPITCANFIELANSGFYDNMSFHRVVKDFVIQGGSPTDICLTDAGFQIKGEFKKNGVDTGLTHPRGAISMARSDDFDSAGVQFFVVHAPAHRLDEGYASFGMMTEGEDVLDEIASVETLSKAEDNKPLVRQTIAKIRVDIDGFDIPKVERIQ